VSRGCACGCGIFDVATSAMFPTGAGWMTFAEWDYQDQNRNWDGSGRAPAANNNDKEIETDFVTLGLQHMFNRSWGVQVDLPYDFRSFKTISVAPGNPVTALNWSTFGDVRIRGLYTGFSPDLSTGLTFGFKLPTGSWNHENAYGDIDRDSEIGTGSTDLLLGAYHAGNITRDHDWSWYAQAQMDAPILTQDHYRPGVELDAATGIYYNGWAVHGVNIRPVAQILGSYRASDSGLAASNPVASGYQRILVSPGLEIDLHPVTVYADVEIPIYQRFTGNQLAAPALFKVAVSYMF
jgi:hypothetical protein